MCPSTRFLPVASINIIRVLNALYINHPQLIPLNMTKPQTNRIRRRQRPSRRTRSLDSQLPQSLLPKRTPDAQSNKVNKMFDNCIEDYSRALVNPFSAKPTCLPHAPALNSLKARTFVKGTFSLNSSNMGWVVAQRALGNNDVLCWTSKSGVASPNIDIGGTYSDVHYNNSPYTSIDISPDGVSWRVVAMGIKVKYVGNQLNMGGQFVSLTEPDHQSLDGKSFASLTAYESSHTGIVTREAMATVYTPIDDEEYRYLSTSEIGNGAFMGIAFSGSASTGQGPYQFEVCELYEAIGKNVLGKTPTPHIGERTGQSIAVVANTPVNRIKKEGKNAFGEIIAFAAPKIIDLIIKAVKAL